MLAIAEREELLEKRIPLYGFFDHNSHSVDAFAEVDVVPAQIDGG